LSPEEVAGRLLERSQAVTETNFLESKAEVAASPEELLKRAAAGERLSEEERGAAANYLAEQNIDRDSPFYGITLIERDLDVLAAELAKYGLEGVPIGRDAVGRGRLVSDMRARLKYVQTCNAHNYDTVREMIDSGADEVQIKKWLYKSGGYDQLPQVTLPGYARNMRDFVANAYLDQVRAGFNLAREAANQTAMVEQTYAASQAKEKKKTESVETYLREIRLAQRYPQVAAVLASSSESDLKYLARSLAAGDVGDTIVNPLHMTYMDAVSDAVKAEMAKPVDPDETQIRALDSEFDPVQRKVRKLRALQAAQQPQREA
jgi:hypothetical protein